MAQILEVLHLAQQDGVAQVQIGRGGVEAGLDAQRRPFWRPATSRSRRSSSRMISAMPLRR